MKEEGKVLTRRRIAVLLTLGIVALLIANGAGFFFRQPYYESWDMAANSLAVERAKHFAEWYGAYSRWGFHHPGPAFFYALALGEWLFYDRLHLTPAPYNAQVLAQVCVSTAFYGASLAVFARRLTRRAGAWFWPLAIALGAAHFGGASELPSYDFLRGPSAFTSTWGVHETVMPFLCLLAAGASVAAGDGRDLPLLAVSAGALLHLHVAQPLFVGPLAVLAYVGLAVGCARRGDAAWRVFPGRHVAAGVILAVFALPLVADVFRGADSNLAAILRHLRTHHGEHKTFLKSLLYFLQFGADTPYAPGRLDFGHFDGAGARAYLRAHALILTGWLLGMLLVSGIAGRRFAEGDNAEIVGRGRFLSWSGGFLCAGIGLTLIWGMIQDGEMFYYNAWLNFALYYFGLLIIVTEFAARREAGSRWPRLERVAAVAAAAWICVCFAEKLRVRDAVPETTAALHESVRRVLAATREGNAARWVTPLEFPDVEWPVAAAVGLELARGGRRFEVDDRWVNVFGRDHAVRRSLRAEGKPVLPWRFGVGPDTVAWHSDAPGILAPATRRLREELAQAPARGGDFPMLDDARLFTALATISPRGGQDAEIDFRRGGNSVAYTFSGWSDAEPWGTWSDGGWSVLRFAEGGCVDGEDVEMTVELHPFVCPSAGLTAQRVSMHINGYHLSPAQRIGEGASTLVWIIPAAAWNANAGAESGGVLELELPDAASPAALDRTGRTGDTRLLGVGVSRMRFRAMPVASGTR